METEASATGRTIIHTSEGGGRKVALVPLGPHGRKGSALLYDGDLTLLGELGLSLSWNRLSEAGVVVAPAKRASGSKVQVARVLLDLGPGENVRYLNGDPTDLRRSNLEINLDGWAIRRDRDFITPEGKRKQWGVVDHEYRYEDK